MLYEIINPSDPYHFEANDLEIAAVCISVLGEGMYAAHPVQKGKYGSESVEGAEKVPIFMFGSQDKWFKKHFNKTFSESFDAVLKTRKNELAEAFESVKIGSLEDLEVYNDAMNAIDDDKKKDAFRKKWIDHKQSSLNDIGGRARILAKNTRNYKCDS
jgi:hypothetical protein